MEYEIKGSYGTMYYVNDMEKSVRYYKETLGLVARYESAGWTEFDVKGTALCLHDIAKGGKAPNEQGILILNVKGLTAMVSALKSKGAEFMGEIREVHPGANCADFRDPSGNHLSLYEDTTH